MKVHIIFAHPNTRSFNGQMRDLTIKVLRENGCKVTVSNLYQEKFKSAADEDDFISLHNSDFFDIQQEQEKASINHTFSDDIKREQQYLSDADLIIFQFPLWWYSMPALLKGYIDRVFSYGFAYGSKRALEGKKILVNMTTGAPEFAWTDYKRGTIKDIFKHLFIGTFGLCGLHPLEPFIVYSAKRLTVTEKEHSLDKYQKYLEGLVMNG
jgi:putative NADPH-quinone reductase